MLSEALSANARALGEPVSSLFRFLVEDRRLGDSSLVSLSGQSFEYASLFGVTSTGVEVAVLSVCCTTILGRCFCGEMCNRSVSASESAGSTSLKLESESRSGGMP